MYHLTARSSPHSCQADNGRIITACLRGHAFPSTKPVAHHSACKLRWDRSLRLFSRHLKRAGTLPALSNALLVQVSLTRHASVRHRGARVRIRMHHSSASSLYSADPGSLSRYAHRGFGWDEPEVGHASIMHLAREEGEKSNFALPCDVSVPQRLGELSDLRF